MREIKIADGAESVILDVMNDVEVEAGRERRGF